MTKFKVGDRVKAIAACDGNKNCVNKTGTVRSVSDEDDDYLPICVEFDEEMRGWGTGKNMWHCEAENLELLDTKPTKPTKPILIIDETPPKENYDNACWYCRKGGLVDLYLNGDMGICPKCGRVCNSNTLVTPIVKKPKHNQALTVDELNALPDGTKLYVVWMYSVGKGRGAKPRWDDSGWGTIRKSDNSIHWDSEGGCKDMWQWITDTPRCFDAYLEEPDRSIYGG